ncbi:MAG: hypothetical protein QM762_25580 [Chryseolinea sp.]
MSLINTTPDGFADGKYVKTDAEYFDFVHDLLSDTDTVAFGRKSFELISFDVCFLTQYNNYKGSRCHSDQ